MIRVLPKSAVDSRRCPFMFCAAFDSVLAAGDAHVLADEGRHYLHVLCRCRCFPNLVWAEVLKCLPFGIKCNPLEIRGASFPDQVWSRVCSMWCLGKLLVPA